MSRDHLLQRLRESVLRLTYTPERTLQPEDEALVDARESVRRLARSRVAAILQQLRAVHGYSYEDVHDRTGLSQQILFDLEFRERRLSLGELRRLAECYQVTVDDILGVDMDEGQE